jgi:hypothetical protein
MRRAINSKHIVEMSASLDNDELGAAVRILAKIASTGRPVPLSRMTVLTQMSEDAWAASSDAILEFFSVDESGNVSHSVVVENQIPDISIAAPSVVGRTSEMPLVEPTRVQRVPRHISREAPDSVSIKKAAFDTLVRLFENSNQTDNAARSVMGSLLKNWPEGDVYRAVYKAGCQEFIADPKSWIIGCLKSESMPTTRTSSRRDIAVPAPKSKREIANAQLLGVSDTTLASIRAKNKTLTVQLKSKAGEQ